MRAKSKTQALKDNIKGKKLPELSFVRLVPNIATVAALCTGLSAIRFAMQDQFETAVLAIVIAAFLDGLDGRLARLLKATSEFGAELDSLSDFISFGVAPAVVVYLLTMHAWRGLGWGVVLFFSVCMALRLARFNVMTLHAKQPTPKSTLAQFSVGVPAPAGAFIALFPLTLSLATEHPFFINPYVYTIFLLGAGILMISRLPTYTFKSMKIHPKMVVPTMILAAILVACIVSIPWITMSSVIFLYLLTLPFSYKAQKKLRFKS
jgi:CDP-diacylglycerol--serine O-phosphatidyltransferase